MKPVIADHSQHPDLLDFRGAFGRLCTLSARALVELKVPRDLVRMAFTGDGSDLATAPIRRQRVAVDFAIERARYGLVKVGCPSADASKLIVDAARCARDAVQGEWGETVGKAPHERWQRLSLPIVNPNP